MQQGVLKLDSDSLVYDGSIVRGKNDGQEQRPSLMEIPAGRMAHLMGKEPTKLRMDGFMKVILLAKLKEKGN